MRKEKKPMDVLEGSIVRNVLIFAIPLALTGVLQQLFNAADVAVVGRFCGKEAMAAVGSNTPVVGLLVNFFTGVSIGANVVIARYTGQGKLKRANEAVHTAVMISVIAGVGLLVIGELMASTAIDLLGVPANVRDGALLYLRIYFMGMPFILLNNFEAAIFRSQGDTQTPLKCLMFGGVLNVGANLCFVLVFGMSVDGVALATVLSNVVSALMMFFILKRSSNEILKFEFSRCRLDKDIALVMLKIGVPSGLQSMVFSISNLCLQSAINSLGSDVMAASAAAFNIEIMVFYIINGFGQACTTFISQNYSAGNYKRCREIARKTLVVDLAVTIVICALIILTGRFLLSLFNKDPVIIGYGYTRILFLMLGEWAQAILDLCTGIMRGLGKSLIPALVTLFGVCGVRILWIFTVFARLQTWNSLVACYPISWLITAIILSFIYIKNVRKLFR